jgi:hypothetical protein
MTQVIFFIFEGNATLKHSIFYHCKANISGAFELRSNRQIEIDFCLFDSNRAQRVGADFLDGILKEMISFCEKQILRTIEQQFGLEQYEHNTIAEASVIVFFQKIRLRNIQLFLIIVTSLLSKHFYSVNF